MDLAKAVYIVRYHGHFLTRQERLAYRHLMGTMKAAHGRSDAAAQLEVRSGPRHSSDWFSDDPEVLSLTNDGWEAFLAHTAERIFDQHRYEVLFNHCCRCGALARTPRAKQCRSCGNDWHARSS
jgi:ribosomal protein L40E